MHPEEPHPGDIPIPEGLSLESTIGPHGPPATAAPPTSRNAEWQHLHGHTWTIRPGHVLDATACEFYDLTDLRNHLLQHAYVLHKEAVADEQKTPSLLVWLHHELNVPRAASLAPATWLNATPLMRLINQRLARWRASAFDAPGDPTHHRDR